MTDKIVAFSTCETEEEASRVAERLIERNLAACVNIVAGVRSVYRWKDKIETAPEILLVIKTRRDLFDALKAEIAKIHSYEIPELVALPVLDGATEYLAWLDRELGARNAR